MKTKKKALFKRLLGMRRWPGEKKFIEVKKRKGLFGEPLEISSPKRDLGPDISRVRRDTGGGKKPLRKKEKFAGNLSRAMEKR